MTRKLQYRLGIDLGTNSLGWAAIQLNQDASERLIAGPLLDMGVRVFPDARNPKDKSSNASKRREPRSARRNRDRKNSRGRAMLAVLERYGLMPSSPEDRRGLQKLDPWTLRAKGLDVELSPYELGRALFHLQQRRGFKSNRKTDGDAEGAMFDAIEDIRMKMQERGIRTLGEMFGRARAEQVQANESLPSGKRHPLPQARVRPNGSGAKLVYDYYPSRDMILDEFSQLWNSQIRFNPGLLSDDARDAIRHVIEHQRPLKPQKAGKCTFLSDQPRAPKALPSSQYARILQEVNNLRVGATGESARPLSPDERELLVQFLVSPSSKTARRTFKAIRKLLNLPESQKFSLESAKRDHLVGDVTSAALMQKDVFGPDWLELSLQTRDEIVAKALDLEQEDELVSWLNSEHGVSLEQARAVSRVRLPDSHGKLSLAALDRIIPRMELGERYDEATTAEFGDHRALGDGEIHENGLPYYGEVLSRHTAFEKDDPKNDEEKFGRVANPTVHVALNQLKQVINDLIRRWGAPTQVVLELARDLPLSDRGLRELESRQKQNQDSNEARRKQFEEQGVPDTYENRLKLRLYEEALDAFGGAVVCVFSGVPISRTELFSDNVEVEHILPLSRTLDDSFSNKVLATRAANRLKGNKTPWEAFGDDKVDGYVWEQIGQRAAGLPRSKTWRFDPDAMERWEERGGGFLDRQLNDTRYIARLGKTFVEALFGGQGSIGEKRHVWVVPGQLTSDLRHFAGFNTLVGLSGGNRKDRTDHRHHAVDALVVALTDQSMVQRAAHLAQQEDKAKHHDMMQLMAEPLRRYRASAEDRLSKLVISHKPDHGFQDAMHNDTAYGVTGQRDTKGLMMLVTRKRLDALSPKDLAAIVDDELRQFFVQQTEGLTGSAFIAAMLSLGSELSPPVRSVRLATPMKDTSYVTIEHGEHHQHKKAYKSDGNYCYDIFLDEKGRWGGEVITTFTAYQLARSEKDWWRSRKGRDGQPLIMRLRKGDMLEIDGPNGERRCVVIYKFSAGRVNMADHFEANASARVRAKELPGYQMSPSSLQKAGAVCVTVTPSGKVRRHKV